MHCHKYTVHLSKIMTHKNPPPQIQKTIKRPCGKYTYGGNQTNQDLIEKHTQKEHTHKTDRNNKGSCKSPNIQMKRQNHLFFINHNQLYMKNHQ